ncbi:uncharacterized protein BP5553_02208 [Venustampulla echinocandica]|uniref:Hypervirulence associated protein TUDOR domain-containing protein n=1 Tax=Venustampulla echinocandica TaxID=2656787 RepID=A0A370U368_9HELO|nr:uncharacterized protein BP5553_02208 [Venustampulla echinocandica]RDL42229.1 hypothetical protein BP5553_02208 [Venustampulla echinocandica]
MSDQVQEVPAGDKVSWVADGSDPTGTAAANPDGLPVTVVAAQAGDESTKKSSDEPSSVAHTETNGNDVAKPADDPKPSVPEPDKKNGVAPSEEQQPLNENKEEHKEEEQEQAPKDPEVGKVKEKEDEITPAQADQGEPQAGEKRKADEKADASEPTDVANGNEVKKQKVEANGAAAPTNGEKKKPGRPKGSGSGSAKKDKKIPAVGRAQRRTRSQATTEN